MVKKHSVSGFQEFQDKVATLTKEDSPLFIYFSGSKNESGQSWCPDCVTAQPIVESTLEKTALATANYLYVGVGGRSEWKDSACVFRTHASTKLKSVPTLFRWGNPQERLEEDQCAKADLVAMLAEQD